MCVGEKIKEYLQSAGVSQAWLSSQTKIPPTKLNLNDRWTSLTLVTSHRLLIRRPG